MRSYGGNPLFENTGLIRKHGSRMSKNGENKCEIERPLVKNGFRPFHKSRCNFCFCPWTSLDVIDSDMRSLINPLNVCSLKIIRDILTWIPKIPMEVSTQRASSGCPQIIFYLGKKPTRQDSRKQPDGREHHKSQARE